MCEHEDAGDLMLELESFVKIMRAEFDNFRPDLIAKIIRDFAGDNSQCYNATTRSRIYQMLSRFADQLDVFKDTEQRKLKLLLVEQQLERANKNNKDLTEMVVSLQKKR